MLRDHFHRLRPVCPACRVAHGEESPLRVGVVARERDEEILEGTLICTNARCQREHPVLDGIPVVLADPASWFNQQSLAILRRADLTDFTMSLLGDLAGASSALDRDRGNNSIYADAHWHPSAPAFLELYRNVRPLLPIARGGLSIDIGCSLGRGTCELARESGDLTVGLDLNFSMLRLAQRIRLSGEVAYERRRVGLVFDPVRYPLPDYPVRQVSFWCADVSMLPFPDGMFQNMLALNMLDCAPSPLGLLLEMARTLTATGGALLATPFDWAVGASQPANWIGGHSQRSTPHQGSSVEELRRYLSHAGLSLNRELLDVPWNLRTHERSVTSYSVYAASLSRCAPPDRHDPLAGHSTTPSEPAPV